MISLTIWPVADAKTMKSIFGWSAKSRPLRLSSVISLTWSKGLKKPDTSATQHNELYCHCGDFQGQPARYCEPKSLQKEQKCILLKKQLNLQLQRKYQNHLAINS